MPFLHQFADHIELHCCAEVKTLLRHLLPAGKHSAKLFGNGLLGGAQRHIVTIWSSSFRAVLPLFYFIACTSVRWHLGPGWFLMNSYSPREIHEHQSNQHSPLNPTRIEYGKVLQQFSGHGDMIAGRARAVSTALFVRFLCCHWPPLALDCMRSSLKVIIGIIHYWHFAAIANTAVVLGTFVQLPVSIKCKIRVSLCNFGPASNLLTMLSWAGLALKRFI